MTDAERTVIMNRPSAGVRLPTPGAGWQSPVSTRTVAAASETVPMSSHRPPLPMEAAPVIGGTRNLVVHLAIPLVAMIADLQGGTIEEDPSHLRMRVVGLLDGFQQGLREALVDEHNAYYAHYALCTVIDELVVARSAERSEVWSRQSLLSQFHGETGGGEHFFNLLESLMRAPARHRSALELMYICLSLGFTGKYRVQGDGQTQLARLREELYRLLRQVGGGDGKLLAPELAPQTKRHTHLVRHIPLWVVFALNAVLLLGIYAGYHWVLNQDVQALRMELQQIRTGASAGWAES